jgi:hypothetical protein
MKIPHLLGLLFIIISNFAIAQTTFSEQASSWGIHLGGGKDGGHSFADYDNDGDLDLLVNTDNSTQYSRLYRNNGNKTYTDVTSSLAPSLLSNVKERCAVWGDLNNDGRLDFARNTSFGGIEVYFQSSGGIFGNGSGGTTPLKIGNSSYDIFVSDGVNTEGLGFLDFDGDGDLDIVFDNHNYGVDVLRNNYINHTNNTVVNPAINSFFSHVTPGTTTALGLNQSATDGDYGSFTDVNNDGWVDIFMRKRDQNDFFLNQGGTFINGADLAQAENGNKGAVALYDFDNDGDFDAFWTENGLNQIFRNDGAGVWTALGSATGIPTSFSTRIDEVSCGDIDNDGDIDIMLVGNNRSFLYYNQRNSNTGGVNSGAVMTFTLDATQSFNTGDGEGTTMVDIDQDGDLDIYMNVNGGNNQLWINNLYNSSTAEISKNYLSVEVLEDRSFMQSGKKRPALGATVVLLDCNNNVLSGVREVNGGGGHGTQIPDQVHFGLPWGANYNYKVLVKYPNYKNGASTTREQVIRWINPSKETTYPISTTVLATGADENCPVFLEICNNGLDDDSDGAIDYLDSDCNCPTSGVANVIKLDFTNNTPMVGTGLNLNDKIRYTNVATIGSQSVDVIATVTSFSNITALNEHTSAGTSASVKLPDMNIAVGTQHAASIKYDLVVAGTTTPISASFEVEIRDLDKTGNRIESITVPQTQANYYYLSNPTNLIGSYAGNNITITGTQDQSVTDPQAAVKFVFLNKSSFTITYGSKNFQSGSTGRAGFEADGKVFSIFSSCFEEICNNGTDDDFDGLIDTDDSDCACSGASQNLIWMVDEEIGTNHLALWSFSDYTNANTGVNYGRLKYKHPVTGVIRDAGDASDMEALAVNPYTGIAYFLSTTDVDGGLGSSVQALFSYDLNNAAANVGNIVMKVIGHISRSNGTAIEALAFDPTSNRFYTAGNGNGTSVDNLYYIDINNLNSDVMQVTSPILIGAISGAGQTNTYVDGLEFDGSGNLYAVDGTDDQLHRINPATGAIIAVVDNNLAGGTGFTSVDIETIAWDPIAQKMIAVDNSNHKVIRLDITQNGNNTVLMDYEDASNMPSGADFEGSAIFNPCIPKFSVGNLVFKDNNANNVFTNGEGVDNVVVSLYQSGANLATTSPIAKDTTSGGGFYLFKNLAAGSYFVHIPSSEFANGKPLFNLLSLGSTGGDNGTDNDDNGLDVANPASAGISSVTFSLTDNGEPTNASTETGAGNTMDDTDDNNGDMTFDFGFSAGAPTELEFCTYNLNLNYNETFNIRDYVRLKSGSGSINWSQVYFTYTLAGANDPTNPSNWNLTNFNNGTNVTVTAADAAPGTGNSGDGQYRIYIVRNGQTSYDDHMEIRVDNGSSNRIDARCEPIICNNNMDDDGDGLIDCADSDCKPMITNVAIIQPTCANKTSGAITITATGTGTFSYSIKNEAVWQSSNAFTNLGVGQYTIRVKNNSGCETLYANPIVFDIPTCPEICNDSIDNDGDGLVDCDDPDCVDVGNATNINNN